MADPSNFSAPLLSQPETSVSEAQLLDEKRRSVRDLTAVAPAAKKPRPNLDSLDGIRGFAAIAIMVGHFFLFFTTYTFITKTDGSFAARMYFPLEFLSPVSHFVVASGFLFGLLYDKAPAVPGWTPTSTDPDRHWHWREILAFLKRRGVRLAPVYYLASAVGLIPFVLMYDSGSISRSIPVQLFAVQSLWVTNGNTWVPPLWTVSAFLYCYLAFPTMLWFVRKMSDRGLLLTILVTSLLGIATCVTYMETSGINNGWALHVMVYYRWPQFLGGVCTGILAKRWAAQPWQHATLLAEGMSSCLALMFILCPVLSTQPNSDFAYYMTFMYYAEFVTPIIHCGWLLGLTHPDCRGWSKAVLSWKPVRMLGEISYSLYCLHWPIMVWAVYAVYGWNTQLIGGIGGGLYYFPRWAIFPLLAVAIVLSWLANKVLEAPLREKVNGGTAKQALKQEGGAVVGGGPVANATPSAAAAGAVLIAASLPSV